jgi:tetratricopeptide (TPR) repeat protein
MLTVLMTTACTSNVAAVDRNADFVAKLRERGWDDTAVEYLDWVEKSPLITPEFRNQLAHERAVSRAAQGRQARSYAERERLLGEAAKEFADHAEGQADSDAGLESLRQAANIYAEQALSILAAAKQLPEQAAAQRQQAHKKARESFHQAAQAAKQLATQCAKLLAAMPKAAAIQNDAAAKARRDQLRNREVEARFLLARLAFEEAATYEPKSAEHSDTLNAASKQFGELAEEHRGTLVDATAKFYQGRCAQELGAYEKALGFYQELTRQPAASGEFRRWTARAHRRRAECLVAIDKLDEAISGAEEWLAGSRPSERNEPEWLELQYALADAYRAKAKQTESGSAAKELQAKARNLLRDVAKAPNEFQQAARLAVASTGAGGGAAAQAKTFDEAFAAAKSSLELWNSSNLAAKLARENNPEAEADLASEASGHRADALRMLELSLDLADAQTHLGQLNAARYYLSVLYWEDKRPHEAAVLSEFLAKRYPESEFAAGAAKVALAAYEQLAIEARSASGAKAGETSYEAGKLAELSELVAARWPESAEASSAVNVLIQTALRENRLSDAEALLERLPAGSRSSAELSLGAGLWMQYLRATAGQRDSASAAANSLRDKAGALLRQGFDGVRKTGNPSASAAVGALYLVQYLLAQGDATGALSVLEDAKAGPLTLVEAQDEAVARPEYVQETYKAALRAYLSAEPPQREKAEQMMAALEESVSAGNGDSGGQLTQIYLSFGVQLQRQLKELDAAGQQAKAAQLAAAFGDLLERVAERPDADSWRIRTWLAQTNLQIGQALAGNEAKAYARRAQDAYEAILAAAERDPKYAPDAAALLGVRMRLGECFAAAGGYDKAIEQYAAILRQRPAMLDLQQAAATALQEWGVAKKDPAPLERSIRGDVRQPDGKNLIWGWLRLAVMADAAKRQTSDPERIQRFEDLFFEARYNVAKSRYLAGTIASGAEKAKQLETARENIEQMQRLYPDLGGAKWKTAFDDLLQQINSELGK